MHRLNFAFPNQLLICCLSPFGPLKQIPEMRWLVNNRNVLLTVVETANPRSGCQHCQERALFPVADFLCPHLEKGAGGSVGPLL